MIVGALLGGSGFPRAEAGGQSGSSTAPSQFAIHGSNTIGARLMPSLVEAYAASIGATAATMAGGQAEEVEIKLTTGAGEPLATIGIQSHGSGTAVPGLISGKALIGMSSRPIDDKEVLALAQAGFPDLRAPGKEHVVGLDGLLVFVAPENPLNALTLDQIAGNFLRSHYRLGGRGQGARSDPRFCARRQVGNIRYLQCTRT